MSQKDKLDVPVYLRVRAARAEEEGDYLSVHVYREAARQLEQLAATEVALASLHMELAEKEHNRVKENKYLLEQLALAQTIVDRLPKDRHGDPIVPNTTRYYVHPKARLGVCEIKVGCDLDDVWHNYDDENVCHRRTLKDDSYATREAAEAAKKGEGDGR